MLGLLRPWSSGLSGGSRAVHSELTALARALLNPARGNNRPCLELRFLSFFDVLLLADLLILELVFDVELILHEALSEEWPLLFPCGGLLLLAGGGRRLTAALNQGGVDLNLELLLIVRPAIIFFIRDEYRGPGSGFLRAVAFLGLADLEAGVFILRSCRFKPVVVILGHLGALRGSLRPLYPVHALAGIKAQV